MNLTPMEAQFLAGACMGAFGGGALLLVVGFSAGLRVAEHRLRRTSRWVQHEHEQALRASEALATLRGGKS